MHKSLRFWDYEGAAVTVFGTLENLEYLIKLFEAVGGLGPAYWQLFDEQDLVIQQSHEDEDMEGPWG
jgi:hypothetical protein